MTDSNDYLSKMPEPPFDGNAADAMLSGSRPPAGSGLGPVADLLHDLRATTTEPPAPPSPALASVLRHGLAVDSPVTVLTPHHRGRRRTQLGWRRVVAPVGLGLTLTAGSLTVAAAADLLPEAVQRAVAAVVNAITPLELPRPTPEIEAPTTTRPAGTGSQVDAPAGGSQTNPGGRSPGVAPGGREPSPQTAGAGTATPPAQVSPSPDGSSLPLPQEAGPQPFPGPPGAPSAGAPPLPGAPTGDIGTPVPPPTVVIPNLPAPPTTALLTPPSTSAPPRLPAP